MRLRRRLDARTAAVELKNIVARVEAGVWQKSAPAKPKTERMPTFHEYASAWLDAKIAGSIGDRPIDVNTQNDYRWRLTKHLLPFFAKYRLDAIDADACQAFKATKLKEATEMRAALAAGADLREKSGRRARPLGPASIRKLITCLAAILDEAVEDGHIERNPARGRRMRVYVPKPSRTFLEMDELVALLDAAGDAGRQIAHVSRARLADKGTTAAKVAECLSEGKSTSEIAAELGRAKSTVGWHIKRLGVEGTRDYIGRRAIIATLGGAGLRASELCDVLMAEVRLHDPGGARLRIPDAKTDAGVREVQLSPDLVEELVAHVDRLRRAGLPTLPALTSSPTAGRSHGATARVADRQQGRTPGHGAARRARPAAVPRVTTPHSLRRTYISIALLANNFDVMWVMSQVGHADSKMTMDVYAQLQQRARRQHGEAFDALVQAARERLYGADPDNEKATEERSIRTRIGTRERKKTLEDVVDEWRDDEEGR